MILNLGAGLDSRPDALNVDKRNLPGIALVYDLDLHPWPIGDSGYDQILALDIFEHLADVVGTMDECWRVLKDGGELVIRGPSPQSSTLWDDPTHRRAFTLKSFDYFDWSTDYGRKYRYGSHPWQMLERVERLDSMTFRLTPIK